MSDKDRTIDALVAALKKVRPYVNEVVHYLPVGNPLPEDVALLDEIDALLAEVDMRVECIE